MSALCPRAASRRRVSGRSGWQPFLVRSALVSVTTSVSMDSRSATVGPGLGGLFLARVTDGFGFGAGAVAVRSEPRLARLPGLGLRTPLVTGLDAGVLERSALWVAPASGSAPGPVRTRLDPSWVFLTRSQPHWASPPVARLTTRSTARVRRVVP